MADIPEGQVSAASLIASGLASLERKDIDRAIADFTRAITLDPKTAIAYRHRGNAHARKRDFKKAIVDFDQAIALAPTDAAAFYFRGRARHLTNNLPGAIADYDKTIKLNPEHLKAFQYREAALAAPNADTRKSADVAVSSIPRQIAPETTQTANGIEVQATLKRVAAIAWLRFWRESLLTATSAAAVSFAALYIVPGLWQEQHADEIELLAGVTSFAIGIVWNVVILKMALLKTYRGFRIALISKQNQEQPATLKRAAAVWWLLLWRGLVGLAVFKAALLPREQHWREIISQAPLFVLFLFVTTAWYLGVMRMALSKRYHDFRIALISNQTQGTLEGRLKPFDAKSSLDQKSPIQTLSEARRQHTTADNWWFWLRTAAFTIIALTITWIYLWLVPPPNAKHAGISSRSASVASASQLTLPSSARKPDDAETATEDDTEDDRDDDHPHRSPIADVAETITSAAIPQKWQTQAVKDQLTDEPRLRARTDVTTESTHYQLVFTCDAKGERLNISTFDRNNSPKPMTIENDGRIQTRADSGAIVTRYMFQHDYFNEGQVDFSGYRNSADGNRLIDDASGSFGSIRNLVIAGILRDEQISVPIDFPSSFRERCSILTQPLRDEVRAQQLKWEITARKKNFPETLRLIAATAETVYVIYGYKGPFTGLSSDAVRQFDRDKLRSPAYQDRIKREQSSYGLDYNQSDIDEAIRALRGNYVNGFDGKIVVRAVSVNGVPDSGFAVAFENIPTEYCIRAMTTAPTSSQQLFQLAAKRAIVDGVGSIDSIQPKRGITQQDAAAMCGTNAMTTVEWIFAN